MGVTGRCCATLRVPAPFSFCEVSRRETDSTDIAIQATPPRLRPGRMFGTSTTEIASLSDAWHVVRDRARIGPCTSSR